MDSITPVSKENINTNINIKKKDDGKEDIDILEIVIEAMKNRYIRLDNKPKAKL